MKNNPFTTSFGKEPQNYIVRHEEEEIIFNSFLAENPPQQVFMLTGVRGSGKTALLTRIKKKLSEEKDWITVELSVESDLKNELIAKLCDEPVLRTQFIKAKLNLSLFGISLGVENDSPVNSVDTALDRILKIIQKLGKRLLITVDEVTNSANIRSFASVFQILLRNDYPIFLIMTGLYKNIYDLQNDKKLTFLYRAPKITLERLNNSAIINSYKKIFSISAKEASEMAAHVKGYAYAYQLYGALCFDRKCGESHENTLEKYGELLGELVYEKLWSELSLKDKEIMTVIARHMDTPVKIEDVIREYNITYPNHTPMSSQLMSVYKKRLMQEGVISFSGYGYIQMALPMFSAYVNEYGVLIY